MVQIVYIYGIQLCSPEVPHPGPCKKRSILQRDHASIAAGGQNCRAPYHSKSRHGENTRPCSGKRRNLTQNARQGYPKATVGDVESYADNSNCRILQKMHGAPHGTHCRMAGNRSTASSRCIPEEITFELAIGYGKQKRAPSVVARGPNSSRLTARCASYLRLPPPSPGRRELPPRLPPRLLP